MPSNRPRRILLHPGFHKTGTSSIQHLLWTNRALLEPHVCVLLLRHLKPAAQICMHYARHQSPVALTDLVDAMDAILAEHLWPGDNRDLILSCEGLSGHLPGWPGVASYAATPVTAAFLAGYFADRMPGADLRIVFTTRTAGDWLHSAWRHHLFGQRLRLDWPTFQTALAPAADLGAVVAEVADAAAPVTVYDLPLEEATHHPHGPGGALLELADLPDAVRARIVPVGRGNPGPDAAMAAAFLDLNLSDLPDDMVQNRKAALAGAGNVGGWARSTPPLPSGT